MSLAGPCLLHLLPNGLISLPSLLCVLQALKRRVCLLLFEMESHAVHAC